MKDHQWTYSIDGNMRLCICGKEQRLESREEDENGILERWIDMN